MKRRTFIAGIGSASAWPVVARAQQQQLPTIGWLHQQSHEFTDAGLPAFRRGLAEMGFVEGRNVTIEDRWAEGHAEREPALVADLARRQVAVIVAGTPGAAEVAKAATHTIPIVFIVGVDPVERGLVASLNRPAGNLTGVALVGPDITAKRLELLHNLVPAAERIAILVGGRDTRVTQAVTRDLQSAARVLGVQELILPAPTESGISAAFDTLVERRAGALLMGFGLFFQTARDQIISLAARHSIPTMFWDGASAAAGALSSYGPDFIDAYHQVGLYTGRILKGEKPADLPVVQPTKFELVITAVRLTEGTISQ